jgi:hypothetical protein
MPGSMGKPSGLPAFPRRYKTIFTLTLIILTVIYLLTATSTPSVPAPATLLEHLPDHIPRPSLPDFPDASSLQRINPFGPPAHKPPVQSNSSDGETKWHADWRWLHPFSSEVTHDDERVVLPPLPQRPPIYTYYDANKKKSKEILEEEGRLLLQWRRAWWAQGFRPVILGRAEALNNPLYKRVQMLKLEDNIEIELARWLAWENMGSGILADTRLFPMSRHDNALLSYLRRGSYPQLTRFEGMKAGLFCGEKPSITDFIEKAIVNAELKKALHFADPMFSSFFQIQNPHESLAYYDGETISKLYKVVSDPLLGDDELKGLRLLGDLINSHLQTTWQSSFVEVAVLKPLAEHTTTLVQPALELAGNLTACPSLDPAIISTCPPNRQRCKKCISSTPIPITTPAAIRNKTDKFFIGTVPHPVTITSLVNKQEMIDSAFVRRLGFKARDYFLGAVTKDSYAGSNEKRLAVLKSTVASEWALPRTLWFTAENPKIDAAELPWLFGFRLPHDRTDARTVAKSETPVPGPERRPAPADEKEEGKARVEANTLILEQRILTKASEAVRAENDAGVRRREAVEMWNLGDTEIWKFVKAFNARRRIVRMNWEKEESKFAGAEQKGGWVRWLD